MANYNGRSGPALPNIEGLNTIPSEWDLQNMNSIDDDLSLFTNGAEFLFDMPDMNTAPHYSQQGDLSQPSSAHPNNAAAAGFGRDDFHFQTFNYPELGTHMPGVQAPSDVTSLPQSVSPSTSASPAANQAASRGEKRKASAAPVAEENDDGNEDVSRMAAEEDKRRRNTAASARFRVKKKQREQAMEKTAKEMTDRVSQLEARVQSLESENKILRDLLTDKVGKDIDVGELHAKFPKEAADAKPAGKQVKADAAR